MVQGCLGPWGLRDLFHRLAYLGQGARFVGLGLARGTTDGASPVCAYRFRFEESTRLPSHGGCV